MQWYDKFLTFIIQNFAFISKQQFELALSTKLANRDYYVCLVGTWLVIIVLIWFTLWISYKIRSWV